MKSGQSPYKRLCTVLIVALTMVGCARIPVPTQSNRIGEKGTLGSCADFFASLDSVTQSAKVIDPGVFRVKHYPYLRVNRFLASFAQDVEDQTTLAAWIDQMQALDHEARKYEIANLPDSAIAELDQVGGRVDIYKKVVACGDLLKAADFQTTAKQAMLKNSAVAPDEYYTLRRALGLYPITKWFVAQGVDRWHSEARKSYLPEPPANWQTTRYAPDRKRAALQEDQIMRTVNRDALGIPIYTDEERKLLFKRFAPIWEIQYQGDDDRIGALRWNLNAELDVDTDKPLTYTQLSFTRFGDDILTQLNYIIWFPARPKEGTFDIYGGFLDGIIFRVTLNSEGIPLLYDTIHNCGCYYKAFPTNQLQVREASGYEEPPLIFKAPEIDPLKERMVISIDSRTHYIQHLYSSSRTKEASSRVYRLVDYGQLRSLPYLEGNRRSMFTQDSLAPGSQRLERYILWPTGVLSPGAMRQSGRHAVSFVGKRHFDEPFYVDRLFFNEDRR